MKLRLKFWVCVSPRIFIKDQHQQQYAILGLQLVHIYRYSSLVIGCVTQYSIVITYSYTWKQWCVNNSLIYTYTASCYMYGNIQINHSLLATLSSYKKINFSQSNKICINLWFRVHSIAHTIALLSVHISKKFCGSVSRSYSLICHNRANVTISTSSGTVI